MLARTPARFTGKPESVHVWRVQVGARAGESPQIANETSRKPFLLLSFEG